jgi:hypothetical protein
MIELKQCKSSEHKAAGELTVSGSELNQKMKSVFMVLSLIIFISMGYAGFMQVLDMTGLGREYNFIVKSGMFAGIFGVATGLIFWIKVSMYWAHLERAKLVKKP